MNTREQPQAAPSVPFWAAQMTRHLDDLRTRSYEGATTREQREAVFGAAVTLVSDTVQRALQAANAGFLDGHGTVAFSGVAPDGSGGAAASWELRWPAQQQTSGRLQPGPVAPVQVIAIFPRGWTHGHLRGRRLGNWPLQVTSASDVAGLEPVIGAIIAAELHEVIYESAGTWQVASGYSAAAAELGDRRLADLRRRPVTAQALSARAAGSRAYQLKGRIGRGEELHGLMAGDLAAAPLVHLAAAHGPGFPGLRRRALCLQRGAAGQSGRAVHPARDSACRADPARGGTCPEGDPSRRGRRHAARHQGRYPCARPHRGCLPAAGGQSAVSPPTRHRPGSAARGGGTPALAGPRP